MSTGMRQRQLNLAREAATPGEVQTASQPAAESKPKKAKPRTPRKSK
jgi:hypothetical protein